MAFQGHFTRAPGYQYHRKNHGQSGFQIFPYKPIHLSHVPMIIPYLSHPKFILYLFNLFHYHALTHTHAHIFIYTYPKMYLNISPIIDHIPRIISWSSNIYRWFTYSKWICFHWLSRGYPIYLSHERWVSYIGMIYPNGIFTVWYQPPNSPCFLTLMAL